MPIITKYFNDKNEEAIPEDATWCRELETDAEGNVIASSTYIAENAIQKASRTMPRTTDYLEKVIEGAKALMERAGLSKLWESLHLAARGHAGGKAKARNLKQIAEGTGLEKRNDAEVLELHRAVHWEMVPGAGNFATGRIALSATGALSLRKAEPDVADVHEEGWVQAAHDKIRDEMKRRKLMHLEQPVAKASEGEVRELVQQAATSHFGKDKYPWVETLESVPNQGSCIVASEGKKYRCDYAVADGAATLSNMTEVKQTYVDVGKESVFISKPYSSIDQLPKDMQDLPKHAKEIMLAAFNAALKEYDDEQKAWATAWAAVKQKYEQQDGKWVSKPEKVDKRFLVDVRKADSKGNIYGLAAIADDEMIKQWIAKGEKADEKPSVIDTQGDYLSEQTLEEMAENYLAKGKCKVGLQHNGTLKEAQVIQSAVIVKGTRWPESDSPALEVAKAWAFGVHCDDDEIKKAAAEGKLTGFSIGGRGERVDS